MVAPWTAASTEAEKECGPTPGMPALIDSAHRKNDTLPAASPASAAGEAAGKVSFFLCAESIKAGIPGVGPHSFSASVLAAVQGATMAEWAYNKKNARSFYRLLDS